MVVMAVIMAVMMMVVVAMVILTGAQIDLSSRATHLAAQGELFNGLIN